MGHQHRGAAMAPELTEDDLARRAEVTTGARRSPARNRRRMATIGAAVALPLLLSAPSIASAGPNPSPSGQGPAANNTAGGRGIDWGVLLTPGDLADVLGVAFGEGTNVETLNLQPYREHWALEVPAGCTTSASVACAWTAAEGDQTFRVDFFPDVDPSGCDGNVFDAGAWWCPFVRYEDLAGAGDAIKLGQAGADAAFVPPQFEGDIPSAIVRVGDTWAWADIADSTPPKNAKKAAKQAKAALISLARLMASRWAAGVPGTVQPPVSWDELGRIFDFQLGELEVTSRCHHLPM